jgi:hypothetical protein
MAPAGRKRHRRQPAIDRVQSKSNEFLDSADIVIGRDIVEQPLDEPACSFIVLITQRPPHMHST